MDEVQGVLAPAPNDQRHRIIEPLPETTTALLMSDGVPRRWTWHVYDHTERAGVRGWAHMFRCMETGKVRRYGLEVA